MSTDETNVGNADKQSSNETSAATGVAASPTESPVTDETTNAAANAAVAAQGAREEHEEAAAQGARNEDERREDERRTSSEDFGQLLDQFEQEQSALQEGEVVRGTVVGITERGVLIDFGYKSEGIVNPNEFMEDGEIAVKRGDEVDVLVK